MAVLAMLAASIVALGPGAPASALPPAQPAFAYGLFAHTNWGAHDNVLDLAYYDDIPPGRNIGAEVIGGPSFGHITVLSSVNADGVPLVSYRANSTFFSGSDSFR